MWYTLFSVRKHETCILLCFWFCFSSCSCMQGFLLLPKLSWVIASLFLHRVCIFRQIYACYTYTHIPLPTSYLSHAKFQISSPSGSLMAALRLRIAQVPTRPPWLFTCHFLILLSEIICCVRTGKVLLSNSSLCSIKFSEFEDSDSIWIP